LSSRTERYQGLRYSRRARLVEASSGDVEHAGRVEAELDRVAKLPAPRLPRSAGPTVDELLRRRHNEERVALELLPYPPVEQAARHGSGDVPRESGDPRERVPRGVLEEVVRPRPGIGLGVVLFGVLFGALGWALVIGLVVLVWWLA
jgi:hypothetical protein